MTPQFFLWGRGKDAIEAIILRMGATDTRIAKTRSFIRGKAWSLPTSTAWA